MRILRFFWFALAASVNELDSLGVKRSSKGMQGKAIQRAMTLIECLVAMSILTIAASILVMAVQGGLAAQEDALSTTIAATAAESRVAEYLARDYNTITALDSTESVGTMLTPMGDPFSKSYDSMGRHTVVELGTLTVPDFPGLSILGYSIDVTVFDTFAGEVRTLVALQRFRPRTIEESAEVAP